MRRPILVLVSSVLAMVLLISGVALAKNITGTSRADNIKGTINADKIRSYVKRRSALMWSFLIADCMIVGTALPILVYLALTASDEVERVTMTSLALMTIATAAFSWWNWRGVLRASAASVADYIEISGERIKRMRLATRAGWIVLIAELILFTIWIRNRLYFGHAPPSKSEEFFAWTWLIAVSTVFIVGLIVFGRWQARDRMRFAALRKDLESSADEHV